MASAQQGDTEAFAALYERTSARALRVATAVCGRHELAAEAVQDAYLALWRARGRFDARQGNFGAWAMTVVRNKTIDLMRRERGGSLVGEDAALAIADPDAPGADDAIASVDAGALREQLAALPDNQREAIVLSFYGGLSHSEIARHLSLPPGTVKGRMRLGLIKLRESVAPELAHAS